MSFPLQPSDIHILVVDDDAALRSALSEFFKALRIDSTETNSGSEALRLLKEDPKFQIILSDIRMADGDGVELLKDVRRSFDRDLKFFLMTGYSSLTIESAYALGVDGLFLKPFSIGTMRDCIQQSFLPKIHLWSRRPTLFNFNIKRSFKDFESMKNDPNTKFGRSGIFFAESQYLPNVGDIASFDLRLKDPSPVDEISGCGTVRWVRARSSEDGPAGFGLEISYLGEESRRLMIDTLEGLSSPATIPLR